MIASTHTSAQSFGLNGRPSLPARRRTSWSWFSFTDRWQVPGTLHEVAAVLGDVERLSAWWPQFASLAIARGDESQHPLPTFHTRCQGFLPYILGLTFRVVSADYPRGFRVEIEGDLAGSGSGNLSEMGDHVRVDLELKVRVNRPLLRAMSLVAWPLLRAQHNWVMQQGEAGLADEIARRRTLGAFA